MALLILVIKMIQFGRSMTTGPLYCLLSITRCRAFSELSGAAIPALSSNCAKDNHQAISVL